MYERIERTKTAVLTRLGYDPDQHVAVLDQGGVYTGEFIRTRR